VGRSVERDRVIAELIEGLTEFESAVAAVLLGTEPGDVISYGEVAAEAGYPGAARAVGNVLKRVDDLPWWRVVTASGRLIPHGPAEQADLLAAEGVATADGRVVVIGE
jgi:methylated-DNA-protein-cysteine methyltransferase-like protein